MRLTSSRCFDAVIIAAFIGAAAVILLTWRYTYSATVQPGQATLERLTAFSTAAAAIGSIFAFIVLVAYTRETYLLRKAAERQLEAASRPIVLLDLSSTDCQLEAPMQLQPPKAVNIGCGPAFNVIIDQLKGDCVDITLQLPQAYIEGKQQLSLKHSITQDGRRSGTSEWLLLLADLFNKDKFPKDMIVSMQFDSISGKKYRTRHRVTYEAEAKRVSTHLVLPVDEI